MEKITLNILTGPGPAYTNVASAKNYKQSTMRLLGLIKSNKGYLAGFYQTVFAKMFDLISQSILE